MRRYSGSPVNRNRLFTLADGSFVVQWEKDYVQNIITGKYMAFDTISSIYYPIQNYELKQLKETGRIEAYNKQFVWLYALPEKGRQQYVKNYESKRIRVYYLSTGLESSELPDLEAYLEAINLHEEYFLRDREGFIVVLGQNGKPFETVAEAETAEKKLMAKASDVFTDLNIGFVETKPQIYYETPSMYDSNGKLDLNEIIASQADTTVTAYRSVVVAIREPDEREAIVNLFSELKMDVYATATGEEMVYLVQDHAPNLLVMDIQLEDVHAWQVLGVLKESVKLDELPIIVIMDDQSLVPKKNITYLMRPVSLARLRHITWKILQETTGQPE